MITIRCDRYTDDGPCDAEISGLAFNAVPQGWKVRQLGGGDHLDYCPRHATEVD